MKTNLNLVAGGVAGLLTAVGLLVGLLFWASSEEASSGGGSQASLTPDAGVTTVPVPALDEGLTTITPSGTSSRPQPEPILIEEEPVDPFAPDLETRGSVRVRRLVVATGVAAHEPTGAADELVIGAQPRVYAFVDAVNETGDPVALNVTFEPEAGESAGHVSLDVPANVRRFRTWAWTRHVYTTGRWHAVVRDTEGHILASRAFDVVER